MLEGCMVSNESLVVFKSTWFCSNTVGWVWISIFWRVLLILFWVVDMIMLIGFRLFLDSSEAVCSIL